MSIFRTNSTERGKKVSKYLLSIELQVPIPETLGKTVCFVWFSRQVFSPSEDPVEQTPGLRYGDRVDAALRLGEQAGAGHWLIRVGILTILVNISMTDS